MSLPQHFEKQFLITADSNKIGYLKTGSGPALILLHGGLQSSASFTDLAAALSDDFTVYVPDRRGRGFSDPYNAKDGLAVETGDLLALIRHVQATYVFALSSGAVIALQAALIEKSLTKVALYEPPIPLNESVFSKLDRDYNKALLEDNSGKAFIAIMKTLDDTSFSLLRILPAFISSPLINLMMRAQSKANNKEKPTLKDLVPTFHHDRIIAGEAVAANLVEQATQLQADVLLLKGGKSQPFLGQVVERLKVAIPNAKLVCFPNQGHMAADNIGAPNEVAGELLEFFKNK